MLKSTSPELLALEDRVSALRNPNIKPYDFGLLREHLKSFGIDKLCPLNADAVITTGGILDENTSFFDRAKNGGGVLVIESKQPGEMLHAGQRYNLEHLNQQGARQKAIVIHHSGYELLKKDAWWFDPVAFEEFVNGRWVKRDCTRQQMFTAIANWYRTGTFKF